MIGDAYLTLIHLASFFFFLSQARVHQKSTSAFARKREKISNWWVQRSKSQVIGCPTTSQSNCQKLSIHLPLSLKSSKHWPTLDRRGQMNSTAIPWRIFFYRIPLARRMKNRIPHGWMIPQYRTLKSKLPKYRLKKSSIPQYRKPPCPPLLGIGVSLSHLPIYSYSSFQPPQNTSSLWTGL